MRLVDGEKRDARAAQQLEAARHQQALGRDIEEIERRVAHVALDLGGLGARERRVEIGRAHARLAQRIDLILHQRDQRRHHHAKARPHQRRDLIAQRLPAARRHQHQGVAAGDGVADDILLLAAKGGIAENLREDPQRLVRSRPRRHAAARIPGQMPTRA
jgi:hypothetical protein